MTPNPSPQLRALRVWHFREAQKNRDLAKNAVATTTGMRYLAQATLHESFVLVLDPLFLASDTAEADAARAPRSVA
jgi:hypothetical protein